MSLTALVLSTMALCDDLELYPELNDKSFQIERNSQNHLTINLKGPEGRYSWLTPLDSHLRPSCSVLKSVAINALQPLGFTKEDIDFQCTDSSSASTAVSIDIDKDDQWEITSLDWQVGWMTLSGKIQKSISVDHKIAKDILGIQNRLVAEAGYLGRDWPGLGIDPGKTLPSASWSYFNGSKYTAGDSVVSAWHIYEIINHISETAESIAHRDIIGIALNTLPLALHTLEGMSHLHQTRLGKYIYLNYYHDLLEATHHPAAAHTGFVSTSLLLNLVELYREYGHQHEGWLGLISRYHNEISLLHHTWELWEAIDSWVSGESHHSH
ncbi:hypothetical protein M3P05_14525 [Sansalvadorimonas sp. 2012CJ34-2]|uniref:Alpha-L-rhamnosidase six-hairpin glycosidase domain-containing protein n=1 Tax=Parendozoicomonas callyspongiae TaxID=2942213 RepID=A0ABT0PL23_9GAMM|nr:hypothetical protein [Sansalvadorimonas sp. 2012CJ34-2]MCL6271138.1 hypothetical protein [Sansalvadorimonas sp. 2012CJ34-2]